MKSRHERLRDFCGLDNLNLLRIVARAAEIVRGPMGKTPSAEIVQEWLETHVTWGLLHCPDAGTIKRHLRNWAIIKKSSRAITLIEAAMIHWGRENLLDYPTKLAIIVAKPDFAYLRDGILAHADVAFEK